MKVKKKIRKRLTKPVRKLVKRYGSEVAVSIVTGLVAATATQFAADRKLRTGAREPADAGAGSAG